MEEKNLSISTSSQKGSHTALNAEQGTAEVNDVVSADGIRRHLTTDILGNRILCLKVTDSTNNDVKIAAQNREPEGLVVIAEEQTAGRGRFGRQFCSPKEQGVYMSVLLRPKYEIKTAALITAATAVCVAEAIEAVTTCEVKIKWVNDLFVNGKKACGILSEGAVKRESRKMEYVIVGIGINISAEGLPAELKSIAGGIAGADKPQRNRLIAEILNRLEQRLLCLSPADFMDEYRKRSNVIGQRVTVLQGDRTESGMALGIDDRACLVVRMDSGEIRSLNSGEISCKVEK